MAAPKRQAKLTDLLPSTSEASTQPSDRDEGDDAVMPLTKKAKHRESGFDPAWKDEFTWIHVVKDHEGPGMAWFALSVTNTIRQLKGWCGSKYRVVFFERTKFSSISDQNVTWILSLPSLMQLLQG